MKDRLTARDIAVIGLSAALIFVIGMVLVVSLTSIFAIPSAMVVFATPLLTMVFTVAALRTRKIGAVSLICLIFGLILLKFTPVGVLAVVVAAILSDLVTKIVYKNYSLNVNITRSTPLMCSFGVWTAYIMMSLFTVEDSIYSQGGLLISLGVSIGVYILGVFISTMTERIFAKRLSWARDGSEK